MLPFNVARLRRGFRPCCRTVKGRGVRLVWKSFPGARGIAGACGLCESLFREAGGMARGASCVKVFSGRQVAR